MTIAQNTKEYLYSEMKEVFKADSVLHQCGRGDKQKTIEEGRRRNKWKNMKIVEDDDEKEVEER